MAAHSIFMLSFYLFSFDYHLLIKLQKCSLDCTSHVGFCLLLVCFCTESANLNRYCFLLLNGFMISFLDVDECCLSMFSLNSWIFCIKNICLSWSSSAKSISYHHWTLIDKVDSSITSVSIVLNIYNVINGHILSGIPFHSNSILFYYLSFP